ncbi:MAG: hypothetical protein H0U13_15375 [Gemmatimonadaceae bacterium]|nr:hypothetical protein [Gemmatimonadaceae bacterium]
MDFRAKRPIDYKGSTSDDVAIRYIGKSRDGRVDLQLNVRTPDTPDDDPVASNRQVSAVNALFPHIPSDIGSMQAHALLCYRDYARTVVDRVLTDVRGTERDLWIVIIATLVSHDERVAKDIRRWSDDRFREARNDPRITTTKHFKDLMMICRHLEKAMSA